MFETFIVMVGGSIVFIGYMEYHFRQVPVKTEAYLKEARRKNNDVKRVEELESQIIEGFNRLIK